MSAEDAIGDYMPATPDAPCCADCAEFNGEGCPGDSAFCVRAADDPIGSIVRARATAIMEDVTALCQAVEAVIDQTSQRAPSDRRRCKYLHRAITSALDTLTVMACDTSTGSDVL